MATALTDSPDTSELDNLPPYSKVGQVAPLFNLSASTVYRLCDEGVIESIKIGGSRRIVTASLRNLLAAS